MEEFRPARRQGQEKTMSEIPDDLRYSEDHLWVRSDSAGGQLVRLPQSGRRVMDYKLEVLTLAVTDVDRAADFYTENAGFVLDVDYHPVPDFRVVQLTPPGSACSIQIGVGLSDATPGSARLTCLAVTDIEAARQELTEGGVRVSDIRHKSPVAEWTGEWKPGPDPERRDYASLADFADPDGNTWVIQEIGFHAADSAGIDVEARAPTV
jgi:catechol 2,3-dioxygenase-like lactoylglutathione lyase family enzyme